MVFNNFSFFSVIIWVITEQVKPIKMGKYINHPVKLSSLASCYKLAQNEVPRSAKDTNFMVNYCECEC